MKKFTALLILVCILFTMTSCAAAKKILAKPGLKPSFSCEAKINYGDFEASATVTRYGDGIWSASFTEPSTLSGVVLDFADGEVSASFKGLKFSIPRDAVSVKAMLGGLIEAFDGVIKSEDATGTVKDGKITIEGKLEQGDYIITVDEKSGFILSFEMPNLDLKMNFSCHAGAGTTENPPDVTTTVTDAMTGEETTAPENTAPAETTISS